MASISGVLRLFLVCLFSLPLSSCATNDVFVKEILTAWRAPPPKMQLEVTDIVERYIPIGMEVEAALEFLRLRKFKVHPSKDTMARRGFEQTYVCNIHQRIGIFTTREIRVVLDINSGRVAARKGFVFIHTL